MSIDNYTPEYDEGMQLQSDQEEAYVMHTIMGINSVISEVGVDIVMKHLDDYAKEQIVKWLAKNY
jgi:predicted component of type VI protein secretion system